ncbi:MAG: EFR1 family ferrodoxin [Promethearchaeota archaeon]
MKTSIYYFSGTGNSLKIARDLSEKLEECELVPIAKVWQNKHLVSVSEKVGFIFPLYFFGLPKIVYDFVDKIEFDDSNYFFAVITRGGDLDCVALYQLEEILKAKSKSLNAGFFVRMPANFYRNDTESEKEQIFREAIREIEKISKIINENGNTPKIEIDEKKKNQWEKINYKFRKTVNINDKSFYADEKCTQCGTCEKICPVNNIILVEGVPQWQHECQQCVACINFCPENSIHYGKKISENQGYHHPEITVQDMINQKG